MITLGENMDPAGLIRDTTRGLDTIARARPGLNLLYNMVFDNPDTVGIPVVRTNMSAPVQQVDGSVIDRTVEIHFEHDRIRSYGPGFTATNEIFASPHSSYREEKNFQAVTYTLNHVNYCADIVMSVRDKAAKAALPVVQDPVGLRICDGINRAMQISLGFRPVE